MACENSQVRTPSYRHSRDAPELQTVSSSFNSEREEKARGDGGWGPGRVASFPEARAPTGHRPSAWTWKDTGSQWVRPIQGADLGHLQILLHLPSCQG